MSNSQNNDFHKTLTNILLGVISAALTIVGVLVSLIYNTITTDLSKVITKCENHENRIIVLETKAGVCNKTGHVTLFFPALIATLPEPLVIPHEE